MKKEEIIKILKTTEKEIKKVKEGTSLENPVKKDLIKTMKAMAYEDILALAKKKKE